MGQSEKWFEQKYGLIARDYYGTAEVGLLAFECSEKNGMHISEEMVVEIVDRKQEEKLVLAKWGK